MSVSLANMDSMMEKAERSQLLQDSELTALFLVPVVGLARAAIAVEEAAAAAKAAVALPVQAMPTEMVWFYRLFSEPLVGSRNAKLSLVPPTSFRPFIAE